MHQGSCTQHTAIFHHHISKATWCGQSSVFHSMFRKVNASVLEQTKEKEVFIIWECRPLYLTGKLRRGKLLQYLQKLHILLSNCDTFILNEDGQLTAA